MSFLNDIATLAKAGYSAQDVKDLMQLNKPINAEEPMTQPTKEEAEQSLLQTVASFESPMPDKSEETATKEIAQPEDAPDYKALYEAEQEKVKALQNKNNSMDVSQNATVNQNDLLDAIRSFC